MTASPHPPRPSWSRWQRAELTTLLLLLIVSAAASIFLAIAGEMREGDTRYFDRAILLAMRDPQDLARPIGPTWAEETVRDLTGLGSAAVLGLLTLAAAGYMAIDRKPHAAGFLLVAVGGGQLVSGLLKHYFQRARPDLVPHLVDAYSTSFPSGHAMLSAVTYLTLGALLARLQERGRLKAYVLGVAVLLTVLVGLSRIYLGVHWPTDVVAGWAAGAAWATFCWAAARALQRHGGVERGGEEADTA